MENNINPVKEYIDQVSKYISISKGISKEEAKSMLKDILSKHKTTNPIVTYRARDDNGDVTVEEDKLTNYIDHSVNNKEVIVPSFTTYVNPDVRKSIHAEFLEHNVKRRSIHKKEAFKAKQENDTARYLYNDVMQKTMKIFNNSLSGAYASKSTIIYNPTAHYTLTSITRCVASIGNACSESVIGGNKFFYNRDLVFNYITSIITNISDSSVTTAITKYNLQIPTVDELMDMIKYSSDRYFQDQEFEQDLRSYLSKLTDNEKVAVMYTNDLYHLRKYNEDLIRGMVTKLTSKHINITDDLNILKTAPEWILTLTHMICADEVRGKNIKYEELVGTDLLRTLISTCSNIRSHIDYYNLLLKTFFYTKIMPISIANIKDLYRDVIVLSDTDSTCGSYGEWVKWYFNKLIFGSQAIAVTGLIMSLNGNIIDHFLNILATNMNITGKNATLLKMKNEFYWDTFTTTNINKHYYANISIQEMNVFQEPELELKGVHLIASNAEQSVVKRIHNMIKEINKEVITGNKLSLYKYIKYIADLERELLDRIDSGDISIYKKGQIKDKEAYKNEEALSPYVHYLMWDYVFKDKYGDSGEPTYQCLKIPTDLTSSKKLKEFLDSLEDEIMKLKFMTFFKQHNKSSFGTFQLPASILVSKGIPKEIFPYIDRKRIVLDNLNAGYIVLQTLGFYKKENLLVSQMGY